MPQPSETSHSYAERLTPEKKRLTPMYARKKVFQKDPNAVIAPFVNQRLKGSFMVFRRYPLCYSVAFSSSLQVSRVLFLSASNDDKIFLQVSWVFRRKRTTLYKDSGSNRFCRIVPDSTAYCVYITTFFVNCKNLVSFICKYYIVTSDEICKLDPNPWWRVLIT